MSRLLKNPHCGHSERCEESGRCCSQRMVRFFVGLRPPQNDAGGVFQQPVRFTLGLFWAVLFAGNAFASISLTLPETARPVANSVLLKASVGDGADVVRIEYKVDGQNVGETANIFDPAVPWDSRTVSDGDHTLTAVAIESNGNRSESPDLQIVVDNSPHWVHTFQPRRARFVGPDGTGSGTSRSDPMSLSAAVVSAEPGDLFWIAGGEYAGNFVLSRPGTKNAPIVFRAVPDERARLDGSFSVTGADNWIWGWEITQSTTAPTSGVDLRAPGVHVINNVIHDLYASNGIGAWNTGAEQVIYGNIIFRIGTGGLNHPHCIYAQNRYDDFGPKYIVGNILMDQMTSESCPRGNCFNFHAYTEGGFISGFHVERNISINGRFLIGGYNEPADRQFVRENFFYRSNLQLGYRRPSQGELRDNYLAECAVIIPYLWGAGETRFQQKAPNVIIGNQIYGGQQGHMSLTTMAYQSPPCEPGFPRLQPSDLVDHNDYGSSFNQVGASLYAANVRASSYGLAFWRSATQAAGNAYDAHSTEGPLPTENKIVLLPNEYEPGRAHLLIFNWARAEQAEVDLSPLVAAGGAFKIVNVKDPFGLPVLSGTARGPIRVALNKDDLLTLYLIHSSEPGPTPAPSPAPRPEDPSKSGFLLFDNVLEPGQNEMSIEFQLEGANAVKLDIMTRAGDRVRTLVDDHLSTGVHTARWDGANSGGRRVASGIYFLRLKIGPTIFKKKIAVLK